MLTETEHVKPGSPTLPASRVVSTKTYDTVCDAVLSDMNAAGNTTSWTINATTCQTLTMTQPPVAGGTPVTTYAYGAFGKLTQKTDPTGLVTQMTYNATNGNLSIPSIPGTRNKFKLTPPESSQYVLAWLVWQERSRPCRCRRR